jgi:hypothetical protein
MNELFEPSSQPDQPAIQPDGEHDIEEGGGGVGCVIAEWPMPMAGREARHAARLKLFLFQSAFVALETVEPGERTHRCRAAAAAQRYKQWLWQ